MNKISIYWKYQFLGWGSFVIVSYVFNNIIYQDFLGFFFKAIFIFLFGLVFSHFIKLTIGITGILKKKFNVQIIYLPFLIIVFSMIGTYVWVMALMFEDFELVNYQSHPVIKAPVEIKGGVWNVDRNVFFYQAYFYNLIPVMLITSGWVLIYFLFHYVKNVRNEERLKLQYKLQLVETEAKALRSQMNPHFIFNCMNSIKSLVQKNDQDKAVTYLTTFSKLLRTIFQNSDKREISLYDEIETCKLYTQLESMRFDNKFNYNFNIDETLDLKSMHVPALIIQPFIENAIWHGIMPKADGGTVTISVEQKDNNMCCKIDDDGIGREVSKQNKFKGKPSIHQSKGIHLTQSRLDLDNTLNKRKATLETIDKKDTAGKSSGTVVVLTFKGY